MREYVRSQTRELLKHLASKAKDAAREGATEVSSAEAVHGLRVAIRRLRRCLRIFAQFYPVRSAKALGRRLGDLMDACGAVRDCDIAIELLKEAGVGEGSSLVLEMARQRRAASRELMRELGKWNGTHVKRHWRTRLDV